MSGQATNADEPRVLVVDDEQNIAELLSVALRYEGFAADTAASGREALEKFDAFRPQILILDVMLPDLDGFEVANRLAGRRSGVPIIFLTARDTTEDKVRGLTLGGDDYVTKPFSVEELIARIRTILRRATKTGDAILALLYSLWEQTGVTVILITHDPAIADTAPRVLRLADGQVVPEDLSRAEGAPDLASAGER